MIHHLIQILGRLVRLYEKNPDKIGKFLLPIIIEEHEGKKVLDESMYSYTRDWVLAICSVDEDFANYFVQSPGAIKIDFNDKENDDCRIGLHRNLNLCEYPFNITPINRYKWISKVDGRLKETIICNLYGNGE